MLKKLIIVFCFSLVGQSFAQEEKSCASIKSEAENCQIALKSLTVGMISGVVSADYSVDKSKKNSPSLMEDFCVVLFTEKDEKLIASTQTNEKGKFKLRKVPDGDYRLVVKSVAEHNFGLTVASIPLKIESKVNRKKEILVHLVPLEIHSCSYAEIQ